MRYVSVVEVHLGVPLGSVGAFIQIIHGWYHGVPAENLQNYKNLGTTVTVGPVLLRTLDRTPREGSGISSAETQKVSRVLHATGTVSPGSTCVPFTNET